MVRHTSCTFGFVHLLFSHFVLVIDYARHWSYDATAHLHLSLFLGQLRFQ
jgi:hypothetical protein